MEDTMKPRGITFLVLTLALVGTLAAAAPPETTVADPGPERFREQIDAFQTWDGKNSAVENAVLFVGSSSIRLWPTALSFPDLPVLNRGFGGAHISDVNHFFDLVVKRHGPSIIVFYAGDNDIAAGKSPVQVFEDYREFVEKVRGSLPGTAVVYLPIKPSLARWNMWPRMAETNALIYEYSDGAEDLSWIDTATPMLGDDGKPRRELFVLDGLHLNETGYELWNSIVGPQLASMTDEVSRVTDLGFTDDQWQKAFATVFEFLEATQN
jgi:lysophospholipase L1-like esterase